MVEGNSRARLRSANNNGSLPIGRWRKTNKTVAGLWGQVAGRTHYKKAAPKKKRRTEARRW
jgi:hypothetical protein